jgi:dephospho-CoA kinase
VLNFNARQFDGRFYYKKTSMLKVGITGGIGSGKSFICNKFAKLGVPVYNADERAKYLMQNDELVKSQLIELFGEAIYENDELNRKLLASIVFNDKDALQQLNAIVHPAVERDTENWLKLHQNYPFVIKEAALLFETGSYKKLDKTILVSADDDLRIARVMERDKVSKQDVEARIKNQMADLDKMSMADFIINNDGKRELDKIIAKLNELFSVYYGFKTAS